MVALSTDLADKCMLQRSELARVLRWLHQLTSLALAYIVLVGVELAVFGEILDQPVRVDFELIELEAQTPAYMWDQPVCKVSVGCKVCVHAPTHTHTPNTHIHVRTLAHARAHARTHTYSIFVRSVIDSGTSPESRLSFNIKTSIYVCGKDGGWVLV